MEYTKGKLTVIKGKYGENELKQFDNEHIAVAEANKLGIPVLALVDTNSDPDPIDCVIACNDDSLKSVKLILNSLSDAIIEKKKEMNVSIEKEGKDEKSFIKINNEAK